ncbi:TetR/AcrR family transcriptional regulator [Streptomyces coeruleorubidus]|uniref:TetR/AcrR family transcriptional regulator n=1 Tax=Streptomyces coeruleorubidus TaxID=116188 RepID=UPI0033FAF6E4
MPHDGRTLPERAAAAGTVRPTTRLSENRVRDILGAAYQMLAETGYQGLRYDGVAARARAGKVTLYRYWPTKAELVTAAVAARPPEQVPVPDTGTLRGDLLAYFGLVSERVSGEEGAVLAGLFVVMRNDPDLASQLRPLLVPAVLPGRVICSRAAERGDITPGHDARLIDEVCCPALFMRSFVQGAPLDARFVEHLTNDIALPLLATRP